MPNFTTEDLLLYIYNEMNPKQAAELEQSLENDWALKQKLQVLREAQEKLNRIQLKSPRTKTLDFILRYASSKLHLSK